MSSVAAALSSVVASALCWHCPAIWESSLQSAPSALQSSSLIKETQSNAFWFSPSSWIEYRATNGLEQQFAVTSARVLPQEESAKSIP